MKQSPVSGWDILLVRVYPLVSAGLFGTAIDSSPGIEPSDGRFFNHNQPQETHMYTINTPRTLIDEFFREFDRPQQSTLTFRPAVDVAQVDDGYLLRAELAGVPKESVKVEVKDQVLTLSGDRPAPSTPAKGYQFSEIIHGKFERRFHLADSIDLDRIEAKFDNGLLEVKLHQKPELGARQVAVL